MGRLTASSSGSPPTSGIVGYGEADSMPAVVKAVIEAPFLNEMMSGLKWVLLDQDPLDIEALWQPHGPWRPSITAATGRRCRRWRRSISRFGTSRARLLGGPSTSCWAARGGSACAAMRPIPWAGILGRPGASPAELRDAGFSAVKFGWYPLGPDAGTG